MCNFPVVSSIFPTAFFCRARWDGGRNFPAYKFLGGGGGVIAGHTTVVLEISKTNIDIVPDGGITGRVKLVPTGFENGANKIPGRFTEEFELWNIVAVTAFKASLLEEAGHALQ